MKKLIIVILALSLTAVACNKTVSVDREPVAQTAPEVAGLSVQQPKTEPKSEPSASKPPKSLPDNSKTVLAPESSPKITKDTEQDVKLENLDNRVSKVEEKVENPGPVPTPTPTPTPISPPADTTPPNVSIQRMINSWLSNDWTVKNGGSIYGTMGLWGSIAPDSPDVLDRIEYYLDGVLIGTLNNPNSKMAWDTTKYSNGSHELSAKVYDKAGNIGTDSAQINIDNNANAGKSCQFYDFGTVVVNRDQTENSIVQGYRLRDSHYAQIGITIIHNEDHTFEANPAGTYSLEISHQGSDTPSLLSGTLDTCGTLTFNLTH